MLKLGKIGGRALAYRGTRVSAGLPWLSWSSHAHGSTGGFFGCTETTWHAMTVLLLCCGIRGTYCPTCSRRGGIGGSWVPSPGPPSLVPSGFPLTCDVQDRKQGTPGPGAPGAKILTRVPLAAKISPRRALSGSPVPPHVCQKLAIQRNAYFVLFSSRSENRMADERTCV